MANQEKFRKLSQKERQNRYFSEAFKKKKVEEIERNITTVAEVHREYQVSRSSVYKWLYKYSPYYAKEQKQVVEAKSDTQKITQLKEQVKDLEQRIGQKQVYIDFLEKLIEEAETHYSVSIKKKNSSSKRSDGSGSTAKNTTGR